MHDNNARTTSICRTRQILVLNKQMEFQQCASTWSRNNNCSSGKKKLWGRATLRCGRDALTLISRVSELQRVRGYIICVGALSIYLFLRTINSRCAHEAMQPSCIAFLLYNSYSSFSFIISRLIKELVSSHKNENVLMELWEHKILQKQKCFQIYRDDQEDDSKFNNQLAWSFMVFSKIDPCESFNE